MTEAKVASKPAPSYFKSLNKYNSTTDFTRAKENDQAFQKPMSPDEDDRAFSPKEALKSSRLRMIASPSQVTIENQNTRYLNPSKSYNKLSHYYGKCLNSVKSPSEFWEL